MECMLTSNRVEVKGRKRASEGHERESEHGPTSLDKNLKSNGNNVENQGFLDDEKKEIKKKKYCGKYTLFGKIQGRVKTRNIVYRHKCKTWGCGVCGPKKLASIKRGIYREAYIYDLRRFMTLTLPGDFQGSYHDSVVALSKSWKKLLIYVERRFGDKVKYIKVVEPQKRGVAHLHVLVSRFIPQAWLSQSWQALGGGKICDIRFVDVHRISGYVSKYMSKAMIGDELGPYRRYSTSREIKINGEKQPAEGEWEFLKTPIDGFWRYAFQEYQEGRTFIIQMQSLEGEIRMFEVEFST